MKKLLVALVSGVLTTGAIASTIGVSNHPFVMQKKVITTEFNSYFSNGTGTGMTLRYMQRVNERLSFDGGIGFTDGDRTSRFVVGSDFQLIPDYGRQPKVSIKGILDTQAIEGDRINALTFAPTISKGLSFWGSEAFPFLALPMKVKLNTDESTYETATALAAGISGRLPIDGYENLVGNIETNISLRNSYAAIVMGVSLPLQ